jgi:hypothetical protein
LDFSFTRAAAEMPDSQLRPVCGANVERDRPVTLDPVADLQILSTDQIPP